MDKSHRRAGVGETRTGTGTGTGRDGYGVCDSGGETFGGGVEMSEEEKSESGNAKDPAVREARHPLADDALAVIRDRATPPSEFREALRRLTFLLLHEATRDLPLEPVRVRTPLAESPGARLRGRLAVVPILRAGLGMVGPVLELIPSAEVWHLGFYRDERTLEPVEYYSKLPEKDPADVALVVDPMLATGGSALAALGELARWGIPDARLLAVIAAPEGIAAVRDKFPSVKIHVCAVDSHLDEHGFIVPGLGDAGDRIFNAEAR